MFVKSLKLRGFRGIKAGIGLDEISLDLSALPDGLIAVCGQNGSGKTTVLDNLHPYRLMPYKCRKAKDWTEQSFNFYDQCYGADACKELCFTMGGIEYRSLVMIDSERRKQEAYLYRRDANGDWFPLNDGKTKTYDSAVEAVVGSPTLFFTSVFRAQSARGLSDYKRSEIVGVFSELLNVDHIRDQSEKCRFVVTSLASSLDLVRERISALKSEAEEANGLQASINATDSAIMTDRLGLEASRGDLEDVRAQITTAREKKAAAESEATRLGMLRSQLADEQPRAKNAASTYLRAATEYDKLILRLKNEHATWKSDMDSRIARSDRIVSGAVKIRAAVAQDVEIHQHIEAAKAQRTVAQDARDAAFKSLAQYNAEVSKMEATINGYRRDAGKLDGLDCRGDGTKWLNPHCRFISDAVAARDALPGLIFEFEAVSSDNTMSDALKSAEIELNRCGKSLATLEADLVECGKLTRLLPELEQVEANLEVWRSEIKSRQVALDDSLRDYASTWEETESRWKQEKEGYEERTAGLQAQVDAFPAAENLDAVLRDLTIKEGAASAAVDGFEYRIRAAEVAVARLRVKLEEAHEKVAEISNLEDRAGRYAHEVAKYHLLQRACSNDGIIALELDDAAPSIASIVNDLLRECYGARFSVRLETQTEKVAGGMKETFDVIVYDSETDSERSITEMSGGQICVLEDAITRGICLFNIHRSDRVYGTLYSDEKDGSLSEDRKLEFMSVKREALRLGTHRREFFISQTPELIDMADATINLAPGSVVVCCNK